MLLPQTPPFRTRPGKPLRSPRPAPPAPLTLVAAEYAFGGGSEDSTVRLTFDRAIDVTGLAAAQVTVDDAAGAGWAYAGTAVASRPDAASVVITLVTTGPAEGPTVLNATAATGIRAADDGGTWAGVADVELPYP